MYKAFPPGVGEHLGYYVYLYSDPRDGRAFYVGKGRGNRVFDHLADKSETEKVAKLAELQTLGLQPRIELLKWGLTKEEALLVESAIIDLLGVQGLTNRVRGHGTVGHRRQLVEDVILDLIGGEATFDEPTVLITINRLWDPVMSDIELYDATRSEWKIQPDGKGLKYAMATYHGVIREVYHIETWVTAGTTMMAHRDVDINPKRREFVGRLAPEPVRQRYRGKTIPPHLRGQNPIIYAGLKP